MNATRIERPYPMGEKDLARFMVKHAEDANGCWVWTSTLSFKGYGRFYYGKTVAAHRASYSHFTGPIPDGLEIDHLCRNRACVNPAHLEAVTRLVNVERMRPDPKRCIRMHLFDEANTYIDKKGARICRKCRVGLNTERRNSGIRDACPYCPISTVEGNLQRHIRNIHPEHPESTWPEIRKVNIKESAGRGLAGKEQEGESHGDR